MPGSFSPPFNLDLLKVNKPDAAADREYLAALYTDASGNPVAPAYYKLPKSGILSQNALKTARAQIISRITASDPLLSRVRNQVFQLLERLNKQAMALGLPDQSGKLQIYRDRFKYPAGFGNNAAYHFSSTKQALEHVCALLDSDKLPVVRRAQVMSELCCRLRLCANGAQSEITYALEMLRGSTGLVQAWRAFLEDAFKVRYLLSRRTEWIAPISQALCNEIHVVNAYVLRCCGPDFLPHVKTQDTSAAFYGKKISDARVNEVRAGFWEYLTADEAVNGMTDRVFDQLEQMFRSLSELPDFQAAHLEEWLAAFMGVSLECIPEFMYTVGSQKVNRIDSSGIRIWLGSHVEQAILKPPTLEPLQLQETRFFSLERLCAVSKAVGNVEPLPYISDESLSDESLLPIDRYINWARGIAPDGVLIEQLLDIYIRSYTGYDHRYCPRVDIDKIGSQYTQAPYSLGQQQLLIRLSHIQGLDQYCEKSIWQRLLLAFEALKSEPGIDNRYYLGHALFLSDDPVDTLADLKLLHARDPASFLEVARSLEAKNSIRYPLDEGRKGVYRADHMYPIMMTVISMIHSDKHFYKHNKRFIWAIWRLGYRCGKLSDALKKHHLSDSSRISLIESGVAYAAEDADYVQGIIGTLERHIDIEEIVQYGNEVFTRLALASLTKCQFESSLQTYLTAHKTLPERCMWLYTSASPEFKEIIESAYHAYCAKALSQDEPSADIVSVVAQDLEWILDLFASSKSPEGVRSLFELFADIPGLRARPALWRLAMKVPGFILAQFGDKPFSEFEPSEMHAAMLMDQSCRLWVAEQWSRLDVSDCHRLMKAWQFSEWSDVLDNWSRSEEVLRAMPKYIGEELYYFEQSVQGSGLSREQILGICFAIVVKPYQNISSEVLKVALRIACVEYLPTSLSRHEFFQAFLKTPKLLGKERDEICRYQGERKSIVPLIKLVLSACYYNQPLCEAFQVSESMGRDQKAYSTLQALLPFLRFDLVFWERNFKPDDMPLWKFVALTLEIAVPQIQYEVLTHFNPLMDSIGRAHLFESGLVPPSLLEDLAYRLQSDLGVAEEQRRAEAVRRILAVPAYRKNHYLQAFLKDHAKVTEDIIPARFALINLENMTHDDIDWIHQSKGEDIRKFVCYRVDWGHLSALIELLDDQCLAYFMRFLMCPQQVDQKGAAQCFSLSQFLDATHDVSSQTLSDLLAKLVIRPEGQKAARLLVAWLMNEEAPTSSHYRDFFFKLSVLPACVYDFVKGYSFWLTALEDRYAVLMKWCDTIPVGLFSAPSRLLRRQDLNRGLEQSELNARLLLADQLELWCSSQPIPSILEKKAVSDEVIRIHICVNMPAYVTWLNTDTSGFNALYAKARCYTVMAGDLRFALALYDDLEKQGLRQLLFERQMQFLTTLSEVDKKQFIDSQDLDKWLENFSLYRQYLFSCDARYRVVHEICNKLAVKVPAQVMAEWDKVAYDDTRIACSSLGVTIINLNQRLNLNRKERLLNNQCLNREQNRSDWALYPILRDLLLGQLLDPHINQISEVLNRFCIGRMRTQAFLKMVKLILSVQRDDMLYPALRAAFGRYVQQGIGKRAFGRLDKKDRRFVVRSLGINEQFEKEARYAYLQRTVDALTNSGGFLSRLYRIFRWFCHFEREREKLAPLQPAADSHESAMPFVEQANDCQQDQVPGLNTSEEPMPLSV